MNFFTKLLKPLVLVAGCFFALSCASTRPLNHELIGLIGGDDRLNEYQYFVSDGIRLERAEVARSTAITDGRVGRGTARIDLSRAEVGARMTPDTRGIVINDRWVVRDTSWLFSNGEWRNNGTNIFYWDGNSDLDAGNLWGGGDITEGQETIMREFRRSLDVGFERLADGRVPTLEFSTGWFRHEDFYRSNEFWGGRFYLWNVVREQGGRTHVIYDGVQYNITLIDGGDVIAVRPHLNIRVRVNERATRTDRRIRGLRV